MPFHSASFMNSSELSLWENSNSLWFPVLFWNADEYLLLYLLIRFLPDNIQNNIKTKTSCIILLLPFSFLCHHNLLYYPGLLTTGRQGSDVHFSYPNLEIIHQCILFSPKRQEHPGLRSDRLWQSLSFQRTRSECIWKQLSEQILSYDRTAKQSVNRKDKR